MTWTWTVTRSRPCSPAPPPTARVTLNADGSFDYVSNAGFNGTDSFTYLANDGQADSNAATVTITVNPTDRPPATELEFHLEVSGTAFGPDGGPIWGGSTFWVSAYVQDLREAPWAWSAGRSTWSSTRAT